MLNRYSLSRSLVALAAAIGLFSCSKTVPVAEGPIEVTELATRIASGAAPVTLDVRSSGEFNDGHIPGALNVAHTELAERLPTLGLSLDEEIVVYCAVGGRAATAEAILHEAGYTNVRDLNGHILAWRDAGYLTESPQER